MQIYDFLKSLSLKERKTLAGQVDCSDGYLSQLVSTKRGISMELADNILNSEFNSALPETLQFTKADYDNYRTERKLERVKG